METFRDTTSIRPNEEIRATWIVRHTLNSRDAIDRAIDFAIAARFQLLFVQVRGRGDAFYKSTLEPVADTLEEPVDAFDPLAYILARAHAAAIAVHAWVNVCYVWSDPRSDPPPNHVVRRHPAWLMADESGEGMDTRPVIEWQRRGVEGYYISPAHPKARAHTVAVIRDIVTRYPVDGIHLDYVRYAGRGFDYNAAARTEFALRYGVDPLELRHGGPDVDMLGAASAAVLDSLFNEWRVGQLDSLVRMIHDAVGSTPLSAAVVPDLIRARADKGQDWLGWVRRGDVDFVVPMAYTYGPAELAERIRVMRRTIGPGRLLVGLPVFNERSAQLGYSVSLLRREGVIGFSLFSYNALIEQRFSLDFLERIFLRPHE